MKENGRPLRPLLGRLGLRDNPRGPHDELWHHSSGCRRVIKVRRDVVTHEIIATGVPSDSLSNSAS